MSMEQFKILEQIFKYIVAYDTIIIHRHQRPDPDAIGSQVGLGTILKHSFPHKQIYCVGEMTENLTYLATMDDISDHLYKGALVMVTDTANMPRISDDRFKLGDMLIKIDHHPQDTPYGDLEWVNTKASSCSEMIVDFYNHFKSQGLVLSDEAARVLYAGIVGDTGRFLYPATTAHTLAIASQLRTYSFDADLLSRQLDEINPNVAKMIGYVYEQLVVDEYGAARIIIPYHILEKYDVLEAETGSLIPLPGKINTVCVWGLFVQQGPDQGYRARLRSKGPSIQEIAKAHHGGGHPLASGADAFDLEEVDAIYNELKQVAYEYQTNKK